MSETADNLNIEWKKSGFDSSEKATRRINEQKAAQYDAYKRNSTSRINSITPADLPKGLNKIRKRIRDIYDDEEEDEDDFQIVAPNITNPDNSLLNALKQEEKQSLAEKENLQRMEMQQKAAQMSVLDAAGKFARNAGLKNLKRETTAMAMTSIGSPDVLLEKVVNDDIAKRLKVKGPKIQARDVNKFFRGIKRIEAVSGGKSLLRGMKVKDIISAGKEKTKDSKINAMILKKSGRKLFSRKPPKKKSSAKAQKEFNKIMIKNTMLKSMER